MSTRKYPPVRPGDVIGVWTALRLVEDAPQAPPSRARWVWRCRCGREYIRDVCQIRASASRRGACAVCAIEDLRLRRGNIEALESCDAGELVAVTVHDVDDLPDV